VFNPSAISVELEHKRLEMRRQAEQRRLIRETKQPNPRGLRHPLSFSSLLTVIRPSL
jgi:hypothetical protein